MRPRGPRYAATLLAALTVAGCSSGAGPADASATGAGAAAPTAAAQPGAAFTESGVTVAVKPGTWDGAKGTVTMTLTPQKPGFHLYSVDLPPDGIDGLGRPTVVKLTGALTATAKPTTASPLRTITVPGTPTELPVYPDGPLTLTVPIARNGSGAAATALVSYAACSETEGCLMPVEDHPVALTLTDKEVTPH